MDNPVLTEWLTAPDGLASRLRALRGRAELTGKELAAALNWGAYKVSRLENGRQLPTIADLKAWADACSALDELDSLIEALERSTSVRLAWRNRLAAGQQQVQASYNALVEASTAVAMFQTSVVPGILQIADYATAVLIDVSANHEQLVEDVAQAVTVRMQRGQMLYDPTKTFELIMTETVLRGSPAPPAVMIAQLDRLLNALDLPNVTLRILPARAGIPFVPVNSFEIYDAELVLVESLAGEEHHTDADGDVSTYRRALERLRVASLTGDDARAVIQTAIEQHRREAI